MIKWLGLEENNDQYPNNSHFVLLKIQTMKMYFLVIRKCKVKILWQKFKNVGLKHEKHIRT